MPKRLANAKAHEEPGPSVDAVRQALEALNASEEFAGSPRLREFLTYVVEERLAGRSDQIKGKTVAVDVYGRDLDSSSPTDNIVRVEARRLRRVLGQYYEGSGRTATIRFHIDAGSYVPRFENLDSIEQPNQTDPAHQQQKSSWVAAARSLSGFRIAAAVGISVFVLLGVSLISQEENPTESARTEYADPQNATRAALMQMSPVAVQSLNMSDQARGLLFPVFDLERQKLAIGLFERAIALDSSLPDGYAGKAQALATLAFLSPDQTVTSNLLQQAAEAAAMAQRLGPTNARTHGALAWVKAISGDHQTAREHTDIAVALLPNDGYILDIDGVVAILSGDGVRAAQASNPERTRTGKGRFGAPNIWGVANYMLGNYQTVIQAFEAAPASGAPVSAPSLMFLAASLDQVGKQEESKAAVEELTKAWPDFPAKFVLHRMFGKSKYATDIYERLTKNGLNLAGKSLPMNRRS